MTTADSNSSALTVDSRGLLANLLRRLLRAGFAHKAAPVEGLISMQRAWQGADEDLVIVDSVTIYEHKYDQALAVREGVDGVPTWGPMRGLWPEVVVALLELSPPEGYVVVQPSGSSLAAAVLAGGLS